MKKFDCSENISLFKNFGSAVTEMYRKRLPLYTLFILIPVSFFFLVALQAMLLGKQFVICLFSHFPVSQDEHIVVRVAVLILFSFIHIVKFLLLGFIDAYLFIFGLFYDLTNKAMTFGKHETIFIDI